MMKDQFFRGPDDRTYDLATHEGRLDVIRLLRNYLPEGFAEALAKARESDPYPVVSFELAKGSEGGAIAIDKREQLLATIGARENSPEEWDELQKATQPKGCVFWVLFWDQEHSWLKSIFIAP
jgi:hypothetical protein